MKAKVVLATFAFQVTIYFNRHDTRSWSDNWDLGDNFHLMPYDWSISSMLTAFNISFIKILHWKSFPHLQ